MDIMELGAVGELVGGVAVIASLLFVGLQVRQSNQQSREAATRELAGQFDRWSEMILVYPNVREAWRIATNDAPARNLANPAGLSADDATNLSIVLYRAFHGFNSQYKAWQAGSLSDLEWTEVIPLIRVHLSSEAAIDWWKWARSGWYNSEFTEFIDREIETLAAQEG